MNLENYIDFDILFITMCILIAYKYIIREENLIFEKKLQ